MTARSINPSDNLLGERGSDWFRRQKFDGWGCVPPVAEVARRAYLAGYRSAIRRNRQVIRSTFKDGYETGKTVCSQT